MIKILGCWEELDVRSGQNVVTAMSRGWRLPSSGAVLSHTMSHQSVQIPAADISAVTAVYAPDPLRLRIVFRSSSQHELPTGHRVVPCRYANLVGAASLADAGQVLGRLLRACHNRSVQRDNGQFDGRRSRIMIFCWLFVLVRGGAPPGTRTPNPLIKSQLLCQLS